MPTEPIVVRPFETAAEREAYYLLASRAFNPDLPEAERENAVAGRRMRAETAPDYDPNNLRGAFRDSTVLGGYRVQERLLQSGAARLLTCCVGSVATHPDARLQGVATALMQDALAYARSRQHALLLLDGIAHFYHRFGYSDVFDITDHTINRALVLAQPPSPIAVREATIDDAPALLALYQRHYGPYTGSFARSLAQYQYLLVTRLSIGNTMALALSPDGQPCGYLLVAGEPDQQYVVEVAADSWPAALALLQYHAHLLDTLPEPAPELCWRMPPDAPTIYLLADHLDVQDTSAWEGPAYGWSVKSQTYHHPDAGWMARVASLPALTRAMLPEWQARWQHGAGRASGPLTFEIGEESFTLELGSDGVRLLEQAPAGTDRITLSQQVLTKLVFGYRPATWAALQPNHSSSADLLALLDTLFPAGRACIAGSDDF